MPIDPEIAENYQRLVDSGQRTWDDIGDMADAEGSPGLAAYARAAAAGKGEDLIPRSAVPSYKNTRSKGIGKDLDGVAEPPISIDKTTPGTRFPDLEPGDVTPVSVDPTGVTDAKAKAVSQNPSTAAKHVQANSTGPVATHPAASKETVKPPHTVVEAQQAYTPATPDTNDPYDGR